MMITSTRDKIGNFIAYEIDWLMRGYPKVVRAGGTIVVTDRRGRSFKITVEEVDDTHGQ